MAQYYYLCNMIQRRIIQFIEKEKLFSKEASLLVALSGGADSVALLRLLVAMGYHCEAAHCNFQLRGSESTRDENFVKELCSKLNIPLHIIRFETTKYATEKHVSIEMAARELRYQWFSELKESKGFTAVAVAHHKDDSAETILLNLIRGTGINGLLGIRPKNGIIVRPLLCVSREEIVNYLEQLQQKYVTDSTNLQDEFTRNKIRLNLLPLMQEINPSVKDSLIETGNYLNQVALLYQKGIEEGKQRVLSSEGIRIDALLKEASPEALLFEILHPLGFGSIQIQEILSSLTGQPGKQFRGKGTRVIKDRKYLLIEKDRPEDTVTPPFYLTEERREYTTEFEIPHDKETACLDADRLTAPLTIRKWQPGDVFVPFGMKGKKLISDYMTDRKFSLAQKERQWVLCSGEKIVWLIGERIDNRFRINKETKNILLLKCNRN